MKFDDRNILAGVKTVTWDDSNDVNMAERTTPSPGTEASFMQQLPGNIGKFNASGATGGTSGL